MRQLYLRLWRMRGENVKKLQRVLFGLGFYAYAIDGIFGKLTDAGVKEFQARYGLLADGIVGPNTWGCIETIIDELAHIIFREAGGAEPYIGRIAVGNVVLNRVNDKKNRWPKTVRDVIYQPGQFTPTNDLPHYQDDNPAAYAYCVPLAEECFTVKAVKDDYFYFSKKAATAYAKDFIRIGNHYFGRDKDDA